MTLPELFEEAIAKKASDLHLATGEAPCLRIDGRLIRMEGPAIELAAMTNLMNQALTGDMGPKAAENGVRSVNRQILREAEERLASGLTIERKIVYNGIAFAGIVFRVGNDGLAATFRVLGAGAPSLDIIGEGAMPLFQKLIDTPRGLVILSGPTGSGKWTTACSIVDRINDAKEARIFVVESHPSYHLSSKRSMLTHLHIGQDCESYERAMEIAHQADIDVIAIDDIPTVEALRQALILADTGHLVFANLHAEGVIDAVERLLLAAGPDIDALRKALSSTLVAIVGQRLFPRKGRPGRVPAYEWIVQTPAVRRAILSKDLPLLAEIQASDPECRTLAAAVRTLVESGDLDEAHEHTL